MPISTKINSGEENKTLNYLIFGALAIVIFILARQFFLIPKTLPPVDLGPGFSKIEINVDVLKSQETQGLLPFEDIVLPEEIGRDNPFAPY